MQLPHERATGDAGIKILLTESSRSTIADILTLLRVLNRARAFAIVGAGLALKHTAHADEWAPRLAGHAG